MSMDAGESPSWGMGSGPIPVFDSVEDSPMFRDTVEKLQGFMAELEKRTSRLVKGSIKYRDAINMLNQQQLAFADCVHDFAGDNDAESILLGGTALKDFTETLKSLAAASGVLGLKVNQDLCEPLQHTWTKGLLKEVQDSRKRWDKRAADYDTARLRQLQPGHSAIKSNVSKWIREDPNKAMAEADHAQGLADSARFELATQLSMVEGKRRYAFLDALAETMDAHRDFFKQGAEAMQKLEPQLQRVREVVAALKEEDERRQEELRDAIAKLEDTRKERAVQLASGAQPPAALLGGPLQMTSQLSGMAADFEAHMRVAGGPQLALKQGYLLKRSSNNVYRDWKRRFFVLSSNGMLYYHSSKEKAKQNTVSLLTATVKADSDEPALRFCFRVISPEKTYTLQAENELERQEWMTAIQGVIACLLNGAIDASQLAGCDDVMTPRSSAHLPPRGRHSRANSAAELQHYETAGPLAQAVAEKAAGGSPWQTRSPSVPPSPSASMLRPDPHTPGAGSPLRVAGTAGGTPRRGPEPLERLRRVAGNDVCCDCGCPDPDWASLNLALLLCIECSGIHRQLGVHVSKVRSLTLDVRVWEEGGIMDMMSRLGNEAGNEVWEERLRHIHQRADSWVWTDDSDEERSPSAASPSPPPFRLPQTTSRQGSGAMMSGASQESGLPYAKPNARHGLAVKEGYIRAKYVERSFVAPPGIGAASPQARLWDATLAGDLRGVMRAVVGGANINHVYMGAVAAQLVAEAEARLPWPGGGPAEPPSPAGDDAPAGVTALHVACRGGPPGLREYLLQNGASHAARDELGRTPLHYAVLYDCVEAAKMLILRGADREAKDASNSTPFETAQRKGAIPDFDLFAMLSPEGR